MRTRLFVALGLGAMTSFAAWQGAAAAAPGAAVQPATAPAVQSVQTEQTFEKQVADKDGTRTLRIRYVLFLPKDHGKDAQKRWPVILFLHGAGERGTNLDLVKKHGPPKNVEKDRDFPFVVVSPQCPPGKWWTSRSPLRRRPAATAAAASAAPETWWPEQTLLAMLDEVIVKYAVDEDRVYMTGLSMGGFGSWTLAAEAPRRFAAVVPICGGGDTKMAAALKDLPVWAFHGGKDPVVPVKTSQDMVDAIEAAGGKKAKLTIFPDAGHDSWTAAYNDPQLYKWLLEQKRAKPSDR